MTEHTSDEPVVAGPDATQAGEPAPGRAEPAPDPAARPAWPPWSGIVAIVAGLVATLLLGGIIAVLLSLAGVDFDESSPGLTLGLTLVQNICLIGAVLIVAAQTARPQPWHFGLRRTPFWKGVGWAAAAFGMTLVAGAIYVVALGVEPKQTTLEDLGAGTGSVATTILIALLVVGVAPVVEEFVFRGFLYGALRTRFGFLSAAAIDGLIFGSIHATTGIKAVPLLIVLGFAFCMVYEKTGSIIPCIGLHALNNMIAFGSDDDGSWAAGAPVALLVIASSVYLASRGPATRPGPVAA